MSEGAGHDLPIVFGGIGVPILNAVIGLILAFASAAVAGAMGMPPAALLLVATLVGCWLYSVLGVLRPRRLILHEEGLVFERTLGRTLRLERASIDRFHARAFDFRTGWLSCSLASAPNGDRVGLGFWGHPYSLETVLETWRTGGLTEAAALGSPDIVVRRGAPAARLLP